MSFIGDDYMPITIPPSHAWRETASPLLRPVCLLSTYFPRLEISSPKSGTGYSSALLLLKSWLREPPRDVVVGHPPDSGLRVRKYGDCSECMIRTPLPVSITAP